MTKVNNDDKNERDTKAEKPIADNEYEMIMTFEVIHPDGDWTKPGILRAITDDEGGES